MGIALFRVDERLIHGQVTVGWGHHLQPHRYLIVDDRLPGTDWERDLVRLGAPEDSEAEFLTVAEARRSLGGWQRGDETVVLLTRDLEHMLRLARGGTLEGATVNLGGIHHRPGRAEVLPYLFLDEGDRRRIESLEAEGATVVAQDLPASPRTGSRRLLHD